MRRFICFVWPLLVYSLFIKGQTPAELYGYLPQLTGWTLAGETEVFNEDNLFDRINGAAPLFIENNFVEMTSMEYTRGDDYITIQAYRHATPEDVFGMYASERSSDLSYLPVGGEGQGDGKSIYFFSGNIYVKMWTNSAEDIAATLQEVAGSLASGIDPDAAYPALVKAFPAEGMIPYSVAYTTANYIGHEFLQSVYTAKYNRNGEQVQAFIIDGKTPGGAREVLDKYFIFTKQPLEYNEGELIIKDRYNGDIPVIWKGSTITGLFNENGNPIEDTSLLEQIAAAI